MRHGLLLLTGTALLVATAGPACAIIRRADREDARYIAAAQALPRPIVLQRAPRGASDGMGTFVAPGWILTAAHVAGDLRVGQALPDDPGLQVTRIVLHPQWDGEAFDLALVQVSGASPYPIVPPCASGDAPGRGLWLVGAGDYGDGLTGPQGHDRALRAAANQIDTVEASALRFDFDAPPDGYDLEGVSGPGDSGGPAYRNGAGVCVAGVSSRQMSSPGQRGRYGAVEVYSRVSTAFAWIRSVVDVPEPAG
jgi:hypothetical protein